MRDRSVGSGLLECGQDHVGAPSCGDPDRFDGGLALVILKTNLGTGVPSATEGTFRIVLGGVRPRFRYDACVPATRPTVTQTPAVLQDSRSVALRHSPEMYGRGPLRFYIVFTGILNWGGRGSSPPSGGDAYPGEPAGKASTRPTNSTRVDSHNSGPQQAPA